MTRSLFAATAVAASVFFGPGLAPFSGAAEAQEVGIAGEIGLGVRLRQEYFGASSYGFSPMGRGALEAITFGPVNFGTPGVRRVPDGFTLRGGFRIVPGRSAEDFPELAGLEDVDFSVELGLGAGYEAENFRVFADPRYGVVGHNAWVAEIGADYILRPSSDLEISVGPRAFFGSNDYADTYFGITAAEANVSSFSAFDPDGGLLSYGIDMRVQRQLNDDWSLRADLEISEFVNGAADSPIVQAGSATHAIFGITLARRFSFGF
ncbi:MipA/OmpV family protein [Rhodobacterales bacterium HKCCE4037]|nr:MipA/OmpV family protein [Rhodobacterales bacterium HKCCE4037]